MFRLGRGYGLGGVFGKTLRDSRWTALSVLALLSTLLLAGGWAMSDTYGSPETRAGLAAIATGMPDSVAQFALTTHLGEPLVGRWDLTGLAICAVMAVGGMAVGAWGLQRRDVAR